MKFVRLVSAAALVAGLSTAALAYDHKGGFTLGTSSSGAGGAAGGFGVGVKADNSSVAGTFSATDCHCGSTVTGGFAASDQSASAKFGAVGVIGGASSSSTVISKQH
jgi:hypothetical protein